MSFGVACSAALVGPACMRHLRVSHRNLLSSSHLTEQRSEVPRRPCAYHLPRHPPAVSPLLQRPLLQKASLSSSSWLLHAPPPALPVNRRASSVLVRSYGVEEGNMATTAVSRIDSHLHVWASPEEAASGFPYEAGQEPTLAGSCADLLKSMGDADVQGALIIQPINHKFDHSYVTSVVRAHPARFVGCCLANPAADGSGVAELRRLIAEEGYRAVRFNPYLWPAGEKMCNAVGSALFSLAGELGAPVGFMCFKGLLLHIDDIEQLCEQHPHTRVIMDHFGFCKSPYHPHSTPEDAEAWNRLLQLARFPQMYVKCSAFFRVSREPYPYTDTWRLVRELADTFRAGRLMWGSDFPFVTAECGYEAAWNIVPSESMAISSSTSSSAAESPASSLGEQQQGESAVRFTAEELASLYSGTVRSLFPGAWGGESG